MIDYHLSLAGIQLEGRLDSELTIILSGTILQWHHFLLTFMPKCLQCLKSFSTSWGVTAHLAQKQSKCNSWECKYIGLHIKSGSEAMEEYSSSEYSFSTPPSPLPHSFELFPTPGDEDFEMSFDSDPLAAIDPFNEDQSNGEQEDSRPSTAASAALLTQLGLGHQIQSFPTTGSIIAIDETFLNCFRMDTMAKIDEYLRLNLCIESLFNHLYYASHMDYFPFHIFTTAERTVQEYSEWMSGDNAWWMQPKLPQGATLCGVILSLDKIHITNMCGGKAAHLLLISLANIKTTVWNKASSHAFLLTALMPIVEFLYPVLRIFLELLKIAARIGRMMSDPVGNLHYCFTPLTTYITDTPEACMLAYVHGKTSPVTMATYKEFGDAFQHKQHTCATTLTQLAHIPCDPTEVERYFAQCKEFRLSRVTEPFFRDWPLSNPVKFFSPELLHHWHREFWDHNIQWCKNTLRARELDFCYSVLHPIVGLHHFKDGIMTLKQVTGGAKSGAALDHWQIPKLELMQSVALSIGQLGVPVQWSADMTEHAHVEMIKEPMASTNNHHYDVQICHYLDRIEKFQLFETATCLSSAATTDSNGGQDILDSEIDEAAVDSADPSADDEDLQDSEHPTALLNDIWAPKRPVPSLFAITEKLLAAVPGTIPYLICTFVSRETALHLNYNPSIKHITINKAAEQFDIPDLRTAIADYLGREGLFAQNFHLFGQQRHSPADAHLPFSEIQIWYKVHLQQKLYHDHTSIGSIFTINAHPSDCT
ncbi:hypothetical protein HD554DRAFT_2039579 [Boletus coccyginus]|nr:hypothetical protein HD554DRAFT_2039579 [Boletus coccyginus]